MIGISNPLPALCVACGVERSDADVNDDGACSECFGDSQAKAARQLEQERADQFQWLSGEWFDRANKAERQFYAATNYPSDCKGAA
jgi:hypothetical protein